MCAQHRVFIYVKGIVHGSGGMMSRNVECFKIMIIVLYLWTFHYIETNGREKVLHAFDRLSHRMHTANRFSATGHCYIDGLLLQLRLNGSSI